MAQDDIVKATGPNGEKAEFVRSAYEKVWADKGWTVDDDSQPRQQNAPAAQDPQTPATPPQQRQAPAQAEPAAKKGDTNR